MIQKIRITKTQLGHYIAGNEYPVPVDLSLINLGVLLSDETRTYNDISWVENPEIESQTGNESHSYKEDGNIVVTIDYLDDSPPFRVKEDTFLKLAKTWLELYRQRPNRIDLTQEGNKFTFEYDSPEGHQKIVIE